MPTGGAERAAGPSLFRGRTFKAVITQSGLEGGRPSLMIGKVAGTRQKRPDQTRKEADL